MYGHDAALSETLAFDQFAHVFSSEFSKLMREFVDFLNIALNMLHVDVANGRILFADPKD